MGHGGTSRTHAWGAHLRTYLSLHGGVTPKGETGKGGSVLQVKLGECGRRTGVVSGLCGEGFPAGRSERLVVPRQGPREAAMDVSKHRHVGELYRERYCGAGGVRKEGWRGISV